MRIIFILLQPFFLIMAILLGSGFVSCGDVDEDESSPDVNEKAVGDNSDAEMEEKVLRYVSPVVSYINYSYHIDITSNLSESYPKKTIKYGIECGYDNYNWQKYAQKDIDNMYSCVSSIFLDTEEEFAEESLYWRSYIALLSKMEDGNLADDEQQLFNGIVKIFKQSESKAKALYQGRVFVEIENKRFYIKEF